MKGQNIPQVHYRLLAIAFIGITAVVHPVHADYFSPGHSCSEPYDRSDEWDVESFKDCIEDFVDEQNSAIRRHRQAANDAIDDWNSFARGW